MVVPLVVQLLIMAFVVMAGFPNKIVVCCIAMGLNSAAYVSEVVRGGINAVDGRTDGGGAVTWPEYGDDYFLYHFAAVVQVRTSGTL